VAKIAKLLHRPSRGRSVIEGQCREKTGEKNVLRRWRKAARQRRRCLDVGWQWVPKEWYSDWKCPSTDSC